MIQYIDKIKLYKGDSIRYSGNRIAKTLEEAFLKSENKTEYGFEIKIVNNKHSGLPIKDGVFSQLNGFERCTKRAKTRHLFIDENRSKILCEIIDLVDGCEHKICIFDYEFIYGSNPIYELVEFDKENFNTAYRVFKDFNKAELEEYTRESIMSSAFYCGTTLGPIITTISEEDFNTWYIPLGLLKKVGS